MKVRLLFPFLFALYGQMFSQDVFTVISNSEDHTIFTELLELTGLDSKLTINVFHSVFAPNDETWEQMYTPEELDSLKINELDYLESLLLNHMVPDVVEIEYYPDLYLPLYGSHLTTFVDGAGSVIITTYGTPTGSTYPRLVHDFNSDDIYYSAQNGRVLWMENSLLFPVCRPLTEVDFMVSSPFINAMYVTELKSFIAQHPGKLTILLAESPEVWDYLGENGGLENTPFLQDYVLRHLFESHIAMQDIEDVTEATNLLGETVVFTREDDRYFVNGNEIYYFIDYKDAATYRIASHLIEAEISNTKHQGIEGIKLFPNPASDRLLLNLPDHQQNYRVQIYSLDGHLLLEQDMAAQEFEIDIERLPSGMYAVEIIQGPKKEQRKLVVFK